MADKENAPVIIIGMHRSGTTLLTKLLHRYGIFMGVNVEHNSESIPYLKLNEKIFKLLGHEWYRVEGLAEAIENNNIELEELTKSLLESPNFAQSYFKKSQKNEKVSEIGWGWKDPRNTYTLPIFKNIYPNARILHIYRNPIDVANSLRTRELKFEKSSKLSWFYHTRKFYLKNGFFVNRSPELVDLNKGVELWKNYIHHSLNYKDDILHIRYESFLENPSEHFKIICEFLSIPFHEEKFNRISQSINPERSYSFINNKELLDLYHNIKNNEIMKRMDYSNILEE